MEKTEETVLVKVYRKGPELEISTVYLRNSKDLREF